MPDYTVVGGSLRPAIEILWTGEPPVTPEDIEAQYQHARTLNLPTLSVTTDPVPSNGRKLAVVGGGPSINDHVETFRNWDGDIWAINGAYHWLKARGISSTFIACDPHVIVADWAKQVEKALVTSRCHPKVFEVLKANSADIRVFDLDGQHKIISQSSTAGCAIHLAVLDGYKDGSWFGCESCYPPGQTHAYLHEKRTEEMIVRVGVEEFHTAPDFFIQALEMSSVLRKAEGLREESGGLLRALIKDPDYHITWISEGLFKQIKPKEIPDEQKAA